MKYNNSSGKIKFLLLTFFLSIFLTTQFTYGAAIYGTVIDEKSTATVSEATIYLVQKKNEKFHPLDSTITDEHGNYFFYDIDTGSYVVNVVKAGYIPVSLFLHIDDKIQTIHQQAELASTGKMHPSDGVITGIVVDSETNKPIASAKVSIYFQNNLVATQLSDENGSYSFQALTRFIGYRISVVANGYEPQNVSNVWLGNDTLYVNFKVTKQSKSHGSLVIFVRNRNEKRKPLASAYVAAICYDCPQRYEGFSNEQGLVNFDEVASGTYIISASLSNYIMESITTRLEKDENDTVFILLTQGTAPRSKTIEGIVYSNGSKIENAVVIFGSENNQRRLVLCDTTDSSGQYSITGVPFHFRDGRIYVTKEGFEEYVINLSVITQDTTVLNINLSSKSSFSITTPRKPKYFNKTSEFGFKSSDTLYNGIFRLCNLNGQILFCGTLTKQQSISQTVILPNTTITLMVIESNKGNVIKKKYPPINKGKYLRGLR